MTRLRDKGGANPNSLYELTNGYVTAARTMRSRPGTTRHATLPAETRGLTTYKGQLTTFCHRPVAVPSGFVLEVIGHPSQSNLALREIHFAAPIMGFLFVSAEYANGDLFCFWLERLTPWSPGAVIAPGQVIAPVSPTGYSYQAARTTAPRAAWTASAPRAVGDVVEPTAGGSYQHTVVETYGPNPTSGAQEPTWSTLNGGTTIESVDVSATAADAVPDTGIRPEAEFARQIISERYPGFGRLQE
jgi:hypothetical protein